MSTKPLRRIALVSTLAALPCSVMAEPATVAELRAAGAMSLTMEQVRQRLPKAEVTHVVESGMERRWVNQEDGSFVARASNPLLPKAPPQSGAGTWRVDERGAYCVNIDWFSRKEAWCQFVFTLGEKHYLAYSQTNPDARVTLVNLSR